MKEKPSAIDKKRDGPGTIKLSDPVGDTPIKKMVPLDGSMHCITEQSVFVVKLPDEIDPARTNIVVSPIHKKVLAYGFNNQTFQQIFLLAEGLFVNTYLGSEFNCDAAILYSWKATTILLEMKEISEKLETEINTIIEKGLLPDAGQSQNIPSIKNLETDVNMFVSKADQIRNIILQILKVFYDVKAGKKVFGELEGAIRSRHGEGSEMLKILKDIKPFLEFIRNIRNAVEHPKEPEKLIILDFNPTPEFTIDVPTVQLTHPTTPLNKTNTISFMKRVHEDLLDSVESIIIKLCAFNLKPPGKFECGILKLDDDTRKVRGVKYSYGIKIQDRWISAG